MTHKSYSKMTQIEENLINVFLLFILETSMEAHCIHHRKKAKIPCLIKNQKIKLKNYQTLSDVANLGYRLKQWAT